MDFISSANDDQVALSLEDKRFLTIVSNGIHIKDGKKFEISLPLKEGNIRFPDNKAVVTRRMLNLKGKLKKNSKLQDDYVNFMKDLIDKGYAEKVPASELNLANGKVWFIPHHGVYHPRKPTKIRVVFDCSFTHDNVSLNKCLLKGPDLTNNLVGILCRFRNHAIGFTCDIEAMYHQVFVNEEDRNLLRFLWFENHNLDGKIIQYGMALHLFGAKSSPSIANFALKAVADKF